MHFALRAALHLALAAGAIVASLDALQAAPSTAAAASRRQAPPPGSLKPLAPADGEVIVRFKAGAALVQRHALPAQAKAEAVQAVLAKRAGELGQRVGRTLEAGEAVGQHTQVVRQRGVDAAELARRIAADPEVEFAEPNGRKRRLQGVPGVPPNDPLYPLASRQPSGPDAGQWYLRRPDSTVHSSIDIEAAWARGFGSASIVVAVLDTGVRFEHPDLGRVANGGRLLPGYDFVTGATVANDGDGRDDDPADPGDWTTAAENSDSNGQFHMCDPRGVGAAEDSSSSWHGTSTASLVAAAANNAIGMAGTAPGVHVLPVRVLGKCFGKDSDIQAAMRWAAGIHVDGVPDNTNPAKVINMSLGSSGACSAGYQAAVDEIVARGVVIVASAGNSAGEPVGTPASCNGVVAIAALRHVGTKVGFSDLGSQITVSAPGGNCINIGAGEPCLYPIVAALNAGLTVPGASIWSDSYDSTLGTSFASPLAAGVVALMASLNPALTVAELRALLQGTARPFPTTGGSADARACTAPAKGTQQLECYCPNPGTATYPLCGAGMLDAGAAVNATALGLALIDANPAAPVKGETFTITSARSLPGAGRNIVGWTWALVSGGGAVSGFSSATNAATATLTPAATGTIVVRLTVTDNIGHASTTTASIVVSDPPPVVDGGGKGGGAFSLGWLLLLGLAVLALTRARKHREA